MGQGQHRAGHECVWFNLRSRCKPGRRTVNRAPGDDADTAEMLDQEEQG